MSKCSLSYCSQPAREGHEFCRKSHYLEWLMNEAAQCARPCCKLHGCSFPVCIEGTKVHDYCSWGHAKQACMSRPDDQQITGVVETTAAFSTAEHNASVDAEQQEDSLELQCKDVSPVMSMLDILQVLVSLEENPGAILPSNLPLKLDGRLFSADPRDVLPRAATLCYVLTKDTRKKSGEKGRWKQQGRKRIKHFKMGSDKDLQYIEAHGTYVEKSRAPKQHKFTMVTYFLRRDAWTICKICRNAADGPGKAAMPSSSPDSAETAVDDILSMLPGEMQLDYLPVFPAAV